jgi:predicted Zn-dependent peptidase
MSEATNAMLSLLNNMPKAEIQFNAAKETVLQSYQTERITKTNIFWSYINNLDRGYDYDMRKDIYNSVQNMDLDKLEEFFEGHIYNKNYNIFILGNKNSIDMKSLSKLGEVEVLSLEDIFNY